jgi:hypothetical protein
MRVFRVALMVFCLGVFVLSVPLVAKADEWNMRTTMTFNQPVEVPGMVLKPGTYVFQLADSPSDRNVVQIFNADQTHLYENLLAIPAYRLEPTDKTVVTFKERAAGEPAAIATWFYPGADSGVEFLYPETKATSVAAERAKPAATPEQPSVAPPQTQPKPASVATQASRPSAQAQSAVAPVPKQEPVQIAQANTLPKPEATSTQEAVRPQKQLPKELPKTASPLPLLGLLGLMSLGASAAVHVFSKQSV